MKKKWLVAVFVSKKENILKTWSCKVSYDVTEVTVPENTVFYFFSTCEEVNLKITQLKISGEDFITWISQINGLVHEKKLYCLGRMKSNSLIVRNLNGQFSLDNFTEFVQENKFELEFV